MRPGLPISRILFKVLALFIKRANIAFVDPLFIKKRERLAKFWRCSIVHVEVFRNADYLLVRSLCCLESTFRISLKFKYIS